MTVYGSAAGRGPATCPDCGRTVPAGDAKLCRYCGYPLMFDAPAPVDQPAPGYLRKPDSVDRTRDPETGMVGGPPQVVAAQQLLGPHCPRCGHRSPARRVRCEVCAAELWPGAASPARRPPSPGPVAPTVRRRRVSLTAVAFVAAAVVAVAAVYLLAYALS
jgi:predicted amidophosphoribosyltransferase